jgi:hypothetical protein
MSLLDWLKNGWIEEHTTSKREISDLLIAAARDLKTSLQMDLDTDWRFNIAYNGALQIAAAALAATGYRARRDAHHFRVIQSLRFTIGAESELIDLLDHFRQKRNRGTYERAGMISDHEAQEIQELAEVLRDRTVPWLKLNHPELID